MLVADAALRARFSGGGLDEGKPRRYLHDKGYGAGELAEGPLLSEDKSQRNGIGMVQPIPNEKEEQLIPLAMV